MKPSGRALELVAIGLGQGGGNIASEFHRRGYRALALNTAHTDLSSLSSRGDKLLLPRDRHLYIGIDGYDGAGADLNYGRDCISQHAGEIRQAVRSAADGADAIVLCAGLGGGTGSSVSELVSTLQDLNIPMLALVTLPNDHESGIAKVNAVRAVNALVREKKLGWIFVDNARLSEVHRDISMAHYFEEINSVIVEPLDSLNRLNDREGVLPIRSLDGEDFRSLLLSSGVLNFGCIPIDELSVDNVVNAVSGAMATSELMPAGFAMDQTSYMGLVVEASPSVLERAPFSLFEEMNEQLKEATGGAAIYTGVYSVSSMGEDEVLVRMFSSIKGLPDGLQGVLSDAKREGGALRDKLNQSMASLDLGEIDDFELFETTIRTTPATGSTPPASGGFSLGEDDTADLVEFPPRRA